MSNELLFIGHITFVSMLLLLALYYGKEALIALITLFCVLANSFVLKQITLCNLNATATDAYMVGAVLGLNLLQEYYGKPSARKAIVISFAASCVYALLGILQVLYTPTSTDTTHAHYCALLIPVPRIVIASLFVYLLVQIIDYYIFGALKKAIGPRLLVIRLWITIAITQLIDTVLFSFLGLYGLVDSLGQLIVISYAIKMLVLMLATPFLALTKKIIRAPQS